MDQAACRAHLRARQERQYQVRERRQAALRSVRVAARSVLSRFPCVRRAYLFGSVLRPGDMRSTSDVDVAVEGSLKAEDYFALWRELERAAEGWLIDLVELVRSAYRLHLDAERLALVHNKARSLQRIYQADVERFLASWIACCRSKSVRCCLTSSALIPI